MKLIIDIPDNEYKYTCERALSDRTFWDDAIRKGTPLDDIKAEIANLDRHKEKYSCVFNRPDLIDLVVDDVLQILDHIGKESEETQSKQTDDSCLDFDFDKVKEILKRNDSAELIVDHTCEEKTKMKN